MSLAIGPHGRTAAALLLAIAVLVCWLVFQPYQTHFQSGLQVLGAFDRGAYFGLPKEGRGDEWSTYLPILKQAYLEGFPAVSSLEPYREKLLWFIGLPARDISLVFAPNLALYFLLPGGLALSFQGVFYNLLLFGSAIWLLRNFGVSTWLAAAAATMLLFSQFYQVWWTSNFPVLGAGLLPFAVITSGLRSPIRFALLAWSVGHLFFGQLYPPFYISLIIGLAPMAIVLRPSILKLNSLLAMAGAVTVAVAAFYLSRADYIADMRATSYPGDQPSVGGGVDPTALLGLLFPTAPVNVGVSYSSTHELAVAGTILPAMAMAVAPFVQWDRKSISIVLAGLTSVLFLALFTRYPIHLPSIPGVAFYGQRAMYGMSVGAIVLSAFVIGKGWRRTPFWSTILASAIIALVALFYGIRSDGPANFLGIEYYAYVPLIAAVVGSVGVFATRSSVPRLTYEGIPMLAVLLTMAVVHVVIYGSFNPVMRATDVLEPVDSQVTRDWKELYALNSHRPIAVIGNYGHLLRGEGLAAYEAIHLANVPLERYAELFPQLSDQQVDAYFNRFHGVAFGLQRDITPGATTFFPAEGYAVPFAHTLGEGIGKEPSIAGVPTAVASRERSGDHFEFWWGTAIAGTVHPEAELRITLPCPASDSWVTRYPYPMQGTTSPLSGIAGRLVLLAATQSEAEQCLAGMVVTVK